MQLWIQVALIAVAVAYEDHYAQYRDPAESTTSTTEPSPILAEYDGVGSGPDENNIDSNAPRARRQPAAVAPPLQIKDANDIKNAVQQILSGRDIDEVLNMVEADPTSPTRSGATTVTDTPPRHMEQAWRDKTDVTTAEDWTTTEDDTADIPVIRTKALTTAATTTDDWTTTTVTEESTDDVTEFRVEPNPSRSPFISIGTEEAGGDVDDDVTGFTEVYTQRHSTALPTHSHTPLTPHRTSSTPPPATTTQIFTTTPTVVTGATPLAARSDSAEYYSDEEPGPAPGAVAALGPGSDTDDAAAAARAADDEALRYRRPRIKPATRSTRRFFDIPIFLEIIQNLTRYVETNITREVNETLLQRWSVGPTCPLANTSSTTPHSTTEHMDTDYGANMTGTIMGKCFVCGLRISGIPQNALCADAFAGDFLPLVPIDPTARGMISEFRKYCRFMDVPRWHYNGSDPRSLWGRWTGGCSVRWVDLTGVYTQRSCRNRHRAVVGRHFASKRMAKLEMALQHTDNGCIISPVATLLPLSRGVNLYARFHACVCTGNWCNTPSRLTVSWGTLLAVTIVLLFISNTQNYLQ